MTVIDEIHHLEKQFTITTDGKAVQDSIVKIQKGIDRLESKFGELEKKLVPPKAKAAWFNLMYSMFRVFTFAFIAAFVPFVTGIGSGINNMNAVAAAAWSAAIAGLAAVLKLAQACVTKDEEPFLDMGIFDGKKQS